MEASTKLFLLYQNPVGSGIENTSNSLRSMLVSFVGGSRPTLITFDSHKAVHSGKR